MHSNSYKYVIVFSAQCRCGGLIIYFQSFGVATDLNFSFNEEGHRF